MKSRTWRAGALAAGIAVVVLLATQRAAGQPTAVDNIRNIRGDVPAAHAVPAGTKTSLPSIPEHGNLIVLGSAFVVVAQQLRRLT